MIWKWMNDIPFPKHRRAYLFLKVCVLIAAALVALQYLHGN